MELPVDHPYADPPIIMQIVGRGRGNILQTYLMDDPPQGNSNKVLQKGRQAENTVAGAAFNEQIASYIIKKALIAPTGRRQAGQ